MMSIPRFSVNHSILGNMLTLVVVLVGIFAVTSLQREVFPETDLDLVLIRTPYPNASPEEVEDLVTVPIEEEVRDVEDIDEYTSTSAEGLSVVVVQLDKAAKNKYQIVNEIQRKVDQVRDLPAEAEKPIVEFITTDQPIINLCVGGEVESEIRDYGDYLRGRIEQIDGVSTVVRTGWRDEEFHVDIDLEKLREQSLSLTEVMAALAKRNVNLPGGKLKEDGEELVVRTIGKFRTAAEIEAVVVRANAEGQAVTVGDLGAVVRGYEDDDVFVKANGRPAIVFGVKMRGDGDSINIADDVKALVAAEQGRIPRGIELTLVDDTSYFVKRRLSVLTGNGFIGFVLVVVCLLLFLNMRVALFTAFGIPFSFLAALAFMMYLGFTINLMTMFGLIIVLGMVVDDAIIVGENVFRHIEEGMDPKAAAVTGTEEVMWPVVSTVLTTIAAFIPLIFAPDLYSKWLSWLVWVVVLCLLASLFEVLFILPAHIADFVKPRRAATGASGGVGHGWMRGLIGVYGFLLRRLLRLRWLFLLLVVATTIGSGFLARAKAKLELFPGDLIDIFMIHVTAPVGTPLAVTEDLLTRVEDRVRALPEDELLDIVTHGGEHFALDASERTRGTHRGQLVVYLTPQNTRPRKTQDVVSQVRRGCADIEGLDHIEFSLVKPGPPTGKPLEVKVRGRDYEVLTAIADRIKAYLAEQPGVSDIGDNFEEGKGELHVRVDDVEVARLGADVDSVARAVFAAVNGAEVTSIREGKEEVVVRVGLAADDATEAQLRRLPILNRNGRLIDLGRIAAFERRRGLPTITHDDGDRVITVGAEIDTEVTTSAAVSIALERAFASVPDEYPGYRLVRSGEWAETRKVMIFMIKAFIVAMLLIYTILSVQLNSFLQPFVLLSAIPLGFIGVILALIVHAKPVSIMAMMGMVGLAGVIVNDAIVLATFINDRRSRGESVVDAVYEAGCVRLRPILLTSVTTIAGLMPVIYGWGGYEPFIAPAAIALAYGLLFASGLTLFVIPCLYMVAHDCRRGLRAVFRAIHGTADR